MTVVAGSGRTPLSTLDPEVRQSPPPCCTHMRCPLVPLCHGWWETSSNRKRGCRAQHELRDRKLRWIQRAEVALDFLSNEVKSVDLLHHAKDALQTHMNST